MGEMQQNIINWINKWKPSVTCSDDKHHETYPSIVLGGITVVAGAIAGAGAGKTGGPGGGRPPPTGL